MTWLNGIYMMSRLLLPRTQYQLSVGHCRLGCDIFLIVSTTGDTLMVHNRNNRYTTPGGRAIPIAQATLHVYGPGNVVLPQDCGVNGSALTMEECTFNHIPFSNPAELWVGRKRPILEHLKQHITFLFAAIFFKYTSLSQR